MPTNRRSLTIRQLDQLTIRLHWGFPNCLKCTFPLEGARPFPDVRLELFPKVFEVAFDRHGRRIAEDTDSLPLHVVADVQEKIQVLFPAPAALDPAKRLMQPRSPFPALRALAARLVMVEARDDFPDPHHAGILVHHDHSARAAHGAGRRQ